MRALRISIVLLAIVLAAHVIEFIGGVRVSPLSICLFPASLLPMLLALAVVPWLAVELVRPMRGHLVVRIVSAIGIALVTFVVCFFAFRFPSYLLGFAYQVRRVATAEQVEAAALKSLEILPHGGQIGAPFAFLRQPGDEIRWQELEKFAFVNLGDHNCTIYVDPPLVEFSWGGALIGHTGIRYVHDGNLSREWDYRIIPWNSKLAFYYSP